MIYLNRANACPTKSEVFSSRPNFWGIFIDFRIKKEPVVYLVDLSHGGGLGVDILPGFGVLLIEVLCCELWSQYQPVEFASDLVFTITWTKTRKFLKRRFSKRPDKLILNAIQAKSNFNSIQSLLCLVLTHQVGGERLLLICRHLVNHDVNQLSADGDNQPLISCQTCPWHSCPQ